MDDRQELAEMCKMLSERVVELDAEVKRLRPWAAAWEVVAKLAESTDDHDGWWCGVSQATHFSGWRGTTDDWECRLQERKRGGRVVAYFADDSPVSAPLAICRAALLAVMGDES